MTTLNHFPTLGKLLATVILRTSKRDLLNILRPYFLKGEFGSLKLLHSRPKAHEPMMSVENLAENRQNESYDHKAKTEAK